MTEKPIDTTPSPRVNYGGSWSLTVPVVRLLRGWSDPTFRNFKTGFRTALTGRHQV